MNRVRIFIVLLVALIAGGGLAAGTYNYLQNVPVKTVTVPTRSVVLANADLSLGHELQADNLAVIEWPAASVPEGTRSEEHTSELQSRLHLVCRLLLEKKKKNIPLY